MNSMNTTSTTAPTRQTAIPPTIPPTPRVRTLLWAGTVLAGLVAVTGLVWLAAPGMSPYAGSPTPAPVQHLLDDAAAGRTVAIVLQVILGMSATALGLAELFTHRCPAVLLGGAAVTCALLGAVGLVGVNGLAVLGYMLAHALPLVLLVVVCAVSVSASRAGGRWPVVLAGAVTVLAVGGLIVALAPLRAAYGELALGIVENPVRFVLPLLLVVFAGLWGLIGALSLDTPGSSVARAVRDHRTGITVAAACCSLPYIVARLSWLTPWPLVGDPHDYAGSAAEMFTTGLILGSGMAAGGVLTLGLILPWGHRIPRWAGRFGGRPVPAGAVVVPAVSVALLFTASGIDSLALAAEHGGGMAPVLETAVVFPFWLWGPLLALATWGYVLHRREPAPTAPVAPRTGQRRRIPAGETVSRLTLGIGAVAGVVALVHPAAGYVRDNAPDWFVLAGVGVAVVARVSARRPGGRYAGLLLATALLLPVAGTLLLLNLLRTAGAIPYPADPVSTWVSLGAAAALLGLWLVPNPLRPPQQHRLAVPVWVPVLGTVAALTYPVLKTLWAFGLGIAAPAGTVGVVDAVFVVTVVLALAAAPALAVALRWWNRPAPRWVRPVALVGGFLLVSLGTSGLWAVARGPAADVATGLLVYGGWLVWGAAVLATAGRLVAARENLRTPGACAYRY